LLASLLLFFIGFNYLEGALPSMISRRAPASRRGAALGVYATSQFLGASVGGALGGFAQSHYGLSGAFIACAVLPMIWLLIPAGASFDKHAAPAALKPNS
jgi:MFS family permease